MRPSPAILVSLSVAAVVTGCAHLPRPKPPQAAGGATSRPATLPVASRPTSWPSYSVSEMRVVELPPQTVLHVSAQTNFRDLPATIDRLMRQITDAPRLGNVTFTGPAVFRYLGASADLKRPFTLEVGFPVAAETRPFGPYRVRRDAAPFRAATVTFTGPASMIDKAYDRLVPAVSAAGLTPTDETREVYEVWEGPASERNVVLVAMGVR